MAKAAATELKKELQRVVDNLVDDDDDDDDAVNLDGADYAIQTLSALKDLKLMMNQSDEDFVRRKSFINFQEPPPEFKCPISGLLMKEPVVIASGQTYDEPFIQKWLEDGHQTCPRTNQPLLHTGLTPNHSIKKMITNWCKLHKFEMPRTTPDPDELYASKTNQQHLIHLLEKLSSFSDRTEAAKELRILTNRCTPFRALFGEAKDAISQLFNPILLEQAYSDARLHEDLIAIILNISVHESNKTKILSESPQAVSFLVESLRNEGVNVKTHAAAAMSSLSDLDLNKRILGESGAIRALIDVIEEGHPSALRDVVLAFSNLCTLSANRERSVSEGAVVVITKKIADRVMTEDMLGILAMFSSHSRAIEQMEEQKSLFCLFSMLKEDIREQSTENCVAIIYALCFSSRRNLRKINEVESGYETLSRVARTGTSRAKRKAMGILERMSRFAFVSHTT